MENLIAIYFIISIITAFIYVVKLGDEMPWEYPINMIHLFKKEIKVDKTLTKFGIFVYLIALILWNLITLPWQILGIFTIRMPRLVYKFMYKK